MREHEEARYDYAFDKLRRLAQERKRGTGQGTPLRFDFAQRPEPAEGHYQKDFSYDKAGNPPSFRLAELRRASRHQGYNFYPPEPWRRRDGLACNYNLYIYDVMGRLTQIRDSGRSYTATVTNDWNGNPPSPRAAGLWRAGITPSSLHSYWRLKAGDWKLLGSGFSAEHTYDGFNRLIKTDATVGATTTNYEHVYDGKKHLGNIDVTGTPVNGKVWRWEGGAISYQRPAISYQKEKSGAGERRLLRFLFLLAADG